MMQRLINLFKQLFATYQEVFLQEEVFVLLYTDFDSSTVLRMRHLYGMSFDFTQDIDKNKKALP